MCTFCITWIGSKGRQTDVVDNNFIQSRINAEINLHHGLEHTRYIFF